MKKLFLAFSLIAVFVLTGCTSKKSGNDVVCTMNEDSSGVSMKSTITMGFKADQLETAKFEMDAKLDDSIKSYASFFVSTLEEQFTDYETQYGVKVNVKESSDGAKIDFTMDRASFEKIYGSSNFSADKKSVIADLESSGYSCK